MPDSELSQQAYLAAAKAALNLTWDQLALAAGIAPRALKTYRMPDTSANCRSMPPLARAAVDRLLAERGLAIDQNSTAP